MAKIHAIWSLVHALRYLCFFSSSNCRHCFPCLECASLPSLVDETSFPFFHSKGKSMKSGEHHREVTPLPRTSTKAKNTRSNATSFRAFPSLSTTYGRQGIHHKHLNKIQDPPFVCCARSPVHCSNSFNSALKLKKHYVQSYHGFYCAPCGKGFLTKNQLSQHMGATHRASHPAPRAPASVKMPVVSKLSLLHACGNPVMAAIVAALMVFLLYLHHQSTKNAQIEE